jgi:hypothetical protein
MKGFELVYILLGFENSSSRLFFKEDLPPLKVLATFPQL